MKECDADYCNTMSVIITVIITILAIFLICFAKNIHDKTIENIIQKDSIEYNIKQIDSINYNIIQRDSIIYKYKIKYIEDVEKSKALDDSSAIELFYSLVNDNPL